MNTEPAAITALIRAKNQLEFSQAVDEIIMHELINYPMRVPHDGCSPLVFLIEKFQTDLAMKLIVEGADIKHKSEINYQPLHAAAGVKDTVVFNELIRKGASIHALTTQKASVVHYALVDNLDDEMTKMIFQNMKNPLWTLSKVGMDPAGRKSTGFEMFARYARNSAGVLFALETMGDLDILRALKEGNDKQKNIYLSMRSILADRFKQPEIVGYLDTFLDAKDLREKTAEVQFSAPRPRF